ncbi:hypothetical protein [Paenibacillus polymyxa]|uniref:hypothetical protein n=1 Tax=Paenibacillus polymyxa TaxID=1406 RepID=UPI00215B9191|nr:hypothetical protein [Paenibacillus polymyxa]
MADLFEDFSTGYEQTSQGEPVRLPYKTDSFQTWAQELSSYANRPEAASDEFIGSSWNRPKRKLPAA